MKPPIRVVAGLSALSGYQVLFCDVWGVIHNGVLHDAQACEALCRFRADGGSVILVSNSPRLHSGVAIQLDGLGVPRNAWDAIVTSGDVTRRLIAERAGEGVYFIGAAHNLPLFEGLSAPFVPIDEATYCVCAGLRDDERETADTYADELARLVARDLPMICANPDLVVERGQRLIPCAGAIAQAYERLGGAVTYPGKPSRPIYEASFDMAASLRGAPVEPRLVLAIGDAIRTDVAGAVATGIDVLMVASGLHAADILGEGHGTLREIEEPRAWTWLKSQAFQPDFLMSSLRW